MRDVIFIRIPDFRVTVEQAVSPRLKGRPVGVATSEQSRGRCLSVTEEARRWGVEVGMTVGEARRRCRDFIVLPLNPGLYRRAEAAFAQLAATFTPLVEPYCPGQLFLDVTGTWRLWGEPAEVAARIIRQSGEALRLPVGAGVASNKLVSRVACKDVGGAGMTRVEEGSEEPFMAPHPVGVLPLLDRTARQVLLDLNITRVGQVKLVREEQLWRAVGPLAPILRQQARGIDPEPVIPPSEPMRLTLAEHLATDAADEDTVSGVTARLALEAALRLRHRRQVCCGLRLTVNYTDGRSVTGVYRFALATAGAAQVLTGALDTLRRIFGRRVRVRSVELTLVNLQPQSAQADFFEERSRLDRVLDALDKVRRKYGEGAVALGAAA